MVRCFVAAQYVWLTVITFAAKAMQSCIPLDQISHIQPSTLEYHPDHPPSLTANPLLASMGFVRHVVNVPERPTFMQNDAVIQREPSGAKIPYLDVRQVALDSHSLAAHSFATFPPVPALHLRPWLGLEMGTIRSAGGVTVKDVVEALQARSV